LKATFPRHSHQELEDAIQEGCMKAWLRFGEEMLLQRATDGWLLTAARNYLIDQWRRDTIDRENMIEERERSMSLVSFEGNSDFNIECSLLGKDCNQNKQLLTRLREGFSVKQIAEELGLTIRTINKRIAKLKEENQRRMGYLHKPILPRNNQK